MPEVIKSNASHCSKRLSHPLIKNHSSWCHTLFYNKGSKETEVKDGLRKDEQNVTKYKNALDWVLKRAYNYSWVSVWLRESMVGNIASLLTFVCKEDIEHGVTDTTS